MSKNDVEIRALEAASRCMKAKRFIAMVDVFLELGALTRKNYDDWRMGRVPCLEQVIQMNLSKINVICRAVHASAARGKLKPSWTAYMKWGKGNSIPLRFTRSGERNLEKAWATHYLHPTLAGNPSTPSPNSETPPAQPGVDGKQSQEHKPHPQPTPLQN